MSLRQFIDGAVDVLPGGDVLPFLQFHERRHLPHAGDRQVVDGDQIIGVEGSAITQPFGENRGDGWRAGLLLGLSCLYVEVKSVGAHTLFWEEEYGPDIILQPTR